MNQNFYTKSPENYKNIINITIDGKENPIKANIIMEENTYITVCGYINDCKNTTLNGILIKIYNISFCEFGKIKLNKISETISNKDGFYKFNIPYNGCEKKYRIVAEKNFFPSDNELFYKSQTINHNKNSGANYSSFQNSCYKFSHHRYIPFL